MDSTTNAGMRRRGQAPRTAAVSNVGPATLPESSRRDEEPTQLPELARPPRVGDVIADKWELVRGIGRGGMGRLFAAERFMLNPAVAMKFMPPHLTRDRVSVTRFV